MLEKLMDEVRSGGTVQTTVLAQRLKTSVSMVQAMLEELERLGLLRQIDGTCADACGGCTLVDTCGAHKNTQGRVWMIS